MQLHPMTKEILQQNCTVTRYEQLRALAGKIAADHEAALQAEQIFMSSGNMDRAAWQGHYPYSLTATIERNAAALANSRWLHTWAQYTRERERVQSMGLGRIVDFLENDRLPPDRANDAIRLAIYHQLAGEIEAALPEINDFSIINGTVRHFREYDKKLMELQRRQIAANAAKKEIPAGVRGGPVRNFTEKALIIHEKNKTKRHIAIRNLLNRASRAVMVAKPCFMMSPLSVAQYLEPGRFQFDIVIMDEASQILPENAIGAIMRSAPEGSVVIVGDPKQLPPTNFFREAAQDDNDGNDGTSMQQMASILDAFLFIADCSNGDFRKRQLRWHYRSRHESLIAFSSKYFMAPNSLFSLRPGIILRTWEYATKE